MANLGSTQLSDHGSLTRHVRVITYQTTQDVRRYTEEHDLSTVDALEPGMWARAGDSRYLPAVSS